MQSLSGLTVLETDSNAAGPFAGKLFRDGGAAVLKVEPLSGDVTREVRADGHPDVAPLFSYLNRGKRSLALDLDATSAPEVVRRLASRSDVAIMSPHQSALAGMVRGTNPEIVILLVGTHADESQGDRCGGADELLAFARSGFASVNGRPGRSPLKGSGNQAGFLAGVAAFIAALAQLHEHRKTGCGAEIQTSLTGSLLCAVAPGVLGSQHEGAPPTQSADRFPSAPLQTRKGSIILTVSRPHFWAGIMREIGLEEFGDRTQYFEFRRERYAPVAERVAERVAAREAAELFVSLGQAGVTAGQVMTTEDLVRDRHLIDRGIFGHDEEPTGVPPFRLVKTPLSPRGQVPRLGEHSVEVLHELGFDDAEVESMLKAGEVRGEKVPS